MNETNNALARWIKLALLNLSVVALLGVVMRYKILFSLPMVDQEHFHRAHSFFAFSGWVSQILMTLLIRYIVNNRGDINIKRYSWILLGNMVSAYGMLIAYAILGFSNTSTVFAVASTLISYLFIIQYWHDLSKLPTKSLAHNFFKAALVFNFVSSIGMIALSIIMSMRGIKQNWYFLMIYLFLHFQYNGWFIFACLGLLFDKIGPSEKFEQQGKWVFWLLVLACVPAYFLSALWAPIPTWLYAIVVLASIAQLVAWGILANYLRQNSHTILIGASASSKWLLALSGIAFSIKLLLQLGSTYPPLSQYAFGFRPIVVGYLHLVLLGVITLFILGFILMDVMKTISKPVIQGAVIFSIGVLLNELLLMVQGLNAMAYVSVPYINQALLAVTLLLFGGIVWLNIGLWKKPKNT